MSKGFGTKLKKKNKKKLTAKSKSKKALSLQNRWELGTKYYKSGNLTPALEIFQQLSQEEANNPDLWNFLSCIYHQQGNLTREVNAYEKLLELQPENFAALSNLGVLYIRQGKIDEGISCWKKVIFLKPDYGEAYNNLGELHRNLGRFADARKFLEKAIDLNPNFATAYYNLGIVCKQEVNLGQAISLYEKAIALNPSYENTYNNLGNVYLELGEYTSAFNCYEKAISLKSPDAKHNLLFALHYGNSCSPQQIYNQHRDWGQQYQVTGQNYTNSPDRNRKLNIGYVSGDLKTHSVSYFFEPLLANRNHDSFRVVCYANNKQSDEVTERLKQLADDWRDISCLHDEQVVELIRQDAIDILVDLSGHTYKNRLSVFAAKPAPLQVTYLGYPNTTGLPAMGYRLVDNFVDPEGKTENLHTEKLIRLPNSFLCYQPPAVVPDIKPLPAIANGYITFGSFNKLAKVSKETISLWGQILASIPNSRLLLKSWALKDAVARERIYNLFAQEGINQERLILQAWSDNLASHLDFYNSIDIALDTYPYHGTTTTCEALYMGVPVITLAGKTHVSRVGVSLLSAVGLAEFIGKSPEDYLKKAISLANNLAKRQELKQNLRNKMQSSLLTDGKAFTKNLEAVYRQIWQDWCQTNSKSNKSKYSITVKTRKADFTILTLHHLSATGGTLISKCLSVMSDVILLSEVHPYSINNGFNPFDPIQQLVHQRLLTQEEIQQIFLDRIKIIIKKCQQNNKKLILRDHSHSDFLLKNNAPLPSLVNTLKNNYPIKPLLTLRNPIDSWLSMLPYKWHKNVVTFDTYCDRYLKFLDAYDNYPYYLYEDFVQNPDLILSKMCEYYGIKFNPNYQQEFFKVRLTGDSGRRSKQITSRPRRKYDLSFAEEVNKSANFDKICQRLGYSGIE